jgi:hypothetical protein
MWGSMPLVSVSLLTRPPKYMLMLLLLLLTPAAAQQSEYAVKAALVLNLTKYIEWPQSSNELYVCVTGEGPMGETLKTMLAGKNNGMRRLHVFLLPPGTLPGSCDLLYVAQSSPKKIHAALELVGARNILTVGEADSFTREGGIVGLVRMGEQIQIQINLEAAQAARVKVSARLLNLSGVVRIRGKS